MLERLKQSIVRCYAYSPKGKAPRILILDEDCTDIVPPTAGETLIALLPLSAATSAPFHSRRTHYLAPEANDFSKRIDDLIGDLQSWLVSEKYIEDDAFWSYDLRNKIAQIRSSNGDAGVLRPGNGVLFIRSKLISSKGHQESLYFCFGGMDIMLAKRLIPHGKAVNGLDGFVATHQSLTSIIKQIVGLSLAVRQRRISSTTYLYVHSLFENEKVPQCFIDYVARHLVDEVIAMKKVQSQCLVFGQMLPASDAGHKLPNLERFALKRCTPPFELILSSVTNLEIDDVLNFSKRLHLPPLSLQFETHVSEFEGTSLNQMEPLFAFTSPIWSGFWFTSREINGEQVII